MKRKNTVVYGLGEETLHILNKFKLEKINVEKFYLSEEVFENLNIEELEKTILFDYYNCDNIVCFGNIDLLERMCNIFSRKPESKSKVIFSILHDNKEYDSQIKSIVQNVDNTIIIPSFYSEIIANYQRRLEFTYDIIMLKTIRTLSLFLEDKLSSELDNETYNILALEYGKNKGLSTVFFESIFQDSDIYEKFGYLKYNNDCTLICVIEGDGYSEVLVESIEKHILKYGKTNQINTKIVYTHSENKKITNYKNVTIFALGY